VEAEKVDFGDLIYSALQGMVGSLDPFSSFMAPEEFLRMRESTEGEFGGLGVVVTVRDGFLTIVAPMEDTPGARAGLRAGDRIVQIEDLVTEDVPLEEAVKTMKGEPGTDVTITIYRPSTDETLTLTITRALIEVASVKGAEILEDGVGYVRVTQFNEPTAAKLAEALTSLLDQGMRSLVLDLRNNPGGLLDSAVDVSSLFLPPGKLVVYTQGRRPSQRREYRTDNGSAMVPAAVPVAILVNGGSASAAEIVSGCLQDSERALLIGETTFGKGSVQNIIELPDGSALRLTVAMYYTPSERVIHENGIEPDITVTLSEDELMELRLSQDGLASDEDEGGDESNGVFEDRQLRRAVEVLNGYDAYRRGLESGFSGADGARAEGEVESAVEAVSP
jgi:carboxyl-terminal processing protease